MVKRLFLMLGAVLCLTACHSYEQPAEYTNDDYLVESDGNHTDEILDRSSEGEVITLFVAHEKCKYNSSGDIYASPYGYFVRYEEDGYWENGRVPIINFDYQRGYEYKIDVIIKYIVMDGIQKEPVYEWKNTIYSIKKK